MVQFEAMKGRGFTSLRKNIANGGKREGHDLGRAIKSLKTGLRFSARGAPLALRRYSLLKN
ncbi:MAG: hypothetical protein WBQ43_13730 [Terriglobales bacterium]